MHKDFDISTSQANNGETSILAQKEGQKLDGVEKENNRIHTNPIPVSSNQNSHKNREIPESEMNNGNSILNSRNMEHPKHQSSSKTTKSQNSVQYEQFSTVPEFFEDSKVSIFENVVKYENLCSCYLKRYKVVEKYGDKIWMVETGNDNIHIEVPINQTSDHFFYKICERESHENHLHLMRSLMVFHEFFKGVGGMYTITQGNLISFTRDDSVLLPWDDDIDIMVNQSDWIFVKQLWEKGVVDETLKRKGWNIRKIKIFNVTCLILKSNLKNWVKFAVDLGELNFYKNIPIFECVDVLKCENDIDEKPCSTKHSFRVARGPKLNQSKDIFVEADACGMKFYSVKKTYGKDWLVKAWGNDVFDGHKHVEFQGKVNHPKANRRSEETKEYSLIQLTNGVTK